MLRQLQIRQFAIIDDLVLELGPGMTVLSGETGAGKSILLDALGLLLGDRADSESIRGDAERAEVNAEFDLVDADQARAWLHERDLGDEDDGDICLIRRVVNRDGRGRCYVNGRPVAARDLKELGEYLVDIHGQHAHQKLFRRRAQQEMLDEFGVPAELNGRVADLARAYHEIRARIDKLAGGGEQAASRVEFLRYQVSELEALDLKADELDELATEHRRVANAERLVQDGQQAMALLYENEEGSIHDLLSRTTELLHGLSRLDTTFAEAGELTESASIQVNEAADTLRRTLDHLDLDPGRLQAVEQRLAEIHDLARKHRVAPEALNSHLDALRAELSDIEGASAELEKLAATLAQTDAEYRDAAAALSHARRDAAARMARAVTGTLNTLGMPEGRFNIRVEPLADVEPRAHGLDQTEFEVSANPGQPQRPLARVASGGELSRISLAIQVIAMTRTAVPTMVFDEVDAGIGGSVAEIVGRLLRRLGDRTQVLCVTHLPQVAAQGMQHLHVRKEITRGQTFTHIDGLGGDARVEELARMLGGVKITPRTRAHAREMIDAADEAADPT